MSTLYRHKQKDWISSTNSMLANIFSCNWKDEIMLQFYILPYFETLWPFPQISKLYYKIDVPYLIIWCLPGIIYFRSTNSISTVLYNLDFFIYIYIYIYNFSYLLALLGLCHCMGFSLVVASVGYFPAAVCQLLIAMASLVAREHEGSGAVAPRL